MTRFTGIALFGVVALGIGLSAGCDGLSRVSVSKDFQFDRPMRLAVLDLDWEPPAGQVTPGHTMVSAPNAGQFVADALANRLLEVKGLEVMERSKLAQLLSERDLTQSDLVRQGRYQEIGKFLGVDFLVLGTVNSYTVGAAFLFSGNLVSFSCRCVDVQSSQVVWALSGKHEAPGAEPAKGLDAILDEATPKLHRLLNAQRPK